MGLTSAHNTPNSAKIANTNGETPQTPAAVGLLDSMRKSATPAHPSLKEQEKLFDELKKENFDLKLKCYQYEERLRMAQPANIELVLKENATLHVNNEALQAEIRSMRELFVDVQNSMENQRRNTAKRYPLSLPLSLNYGDSAEQEEEAQHLRQELELTTSQLTRTQTQIKKYETQLELYDKESRETVKRTKQMEMELVTVQRKLADAAGTISQQGEELKELQQELDSKNALVQQMRADLQATTSDSEMLMRQWQDLEQRLKEAEAERDTLLTERDPIKRGFDNLRTQMAPSSPRSSFDVMEGRLMRQLGDATSKIEELEKFKSVLDSERLSLTERNRRLTTDMQHALRTIAKIVDAIQNATSVKGDMVEWGPSMTLEQALEELAKVCDLMLSEQEDLLQQRDGLQEDLSRTSEENVLLSAKAERALEQLKQAKQQLTEADRELDSTRHQLQRTTNDLIKMEQSAKTANELEIPRYREQINGLNTAIATLEGELAASERRSSDARQETESIRRKCAELETNTARAQSELALKKEEISTLHQRQADLLQKLSNSEQLTSKLSKSLEEMKTHVEHAEKVKLALEESFNRDIRSLHSTNTELKAQLAGILSNKSSNDQRLERLQASLKFIEEKNQELTGKLQEKEAAYSTLIRDYEVFKIEKLSLDGELADSQASVRRLEAELARVKRSDAAARKGAEGLEHLQAKIDSLNSLNVFLKEQVETKERTVRESEEKLRRQDEAIKKAYHDLEYQHQKIKKREQIIGRALKRLEASFLVGWPAERLTVMGLGGDWLRGLYRNVGRFRLAMAVASGAGAGAVLAPQSTLLHALLFPFWTERKEGEEGSLLRPVYAWGNNEYRLVAPDLREGMVRLPTRIPFFDQMTLVSVSAGEQHAAAVDSAGNLYQWGAAFFGEPPTSQLEEEQLFQMNPVCTLKGCKLSQVVCSPQAVIALSQAEGKIYIVPIEGKGREEASVQFTLAKIKDELAKSEQVIKIAAGHDHLVALTSEGALLTGALNEQGNYYGQLGLGTVNGDIGGHGHGKGEDYETRPVKQPPGQEELSQLVWTQSSPSRKDSMIGKEEEEMVMVAAMGRNSSNSRSSHPVTLQKIPFVDSRAMDVACGMRHTLVLGGNGRVYGFGSNEMLQLGMGPFERTRTVVPLPTEITSIWPSGIKSHSQRVTRIAAGGETSYFAVDDAQQTSIYAVGAGQFGQLGHGAWSHAQGVPVRVQRVSGMSYYDEEEGTVYPVRCDYLSAGQQHAAAVMRTYRLPVPNPQDELPSPAGEDVYMWGCNRFYQLGLGGRRQNLSLPSTIVPVMLETPSGQWDQAKRTVISTGSQLLTMAAQTANSQGTLADRVLKLHGALLENEEKTCSFVGGQFQLLMVPSDPSRRPIQSVYCGPQITIIH